jgi:hypothetical protein
MRHMPTLVIALLLAAGAAAPQAQAAACRDAAGKFIACPATPQRCRAPNGAFVKCGTPGAKPVTAAKATTVAKTQTKAPATKH